MNRKILLGVVVMLGACYKQEPIGNLPAPSAHVVATLSDAGTAAMANALGDGVLEIEGNVANATDQSWTLNMLRVKQRGDRTIEWKHEPVTFDRAFLQQPRVVTLDKSRSYLAAGGIVVGAFLVARIFNLAGANDSKDDTPQPQQIRIPVPIR